MADENQPAAPQTAAQINAPQTGTVDTDPNPAATTVLNGKTERELALEREVEEHKAARKKAETLAAEKEDLARQLKELQTATPAPAKPTPEKKSSGFFFE